MQLDAFLNRLVLFVSGDVFGFGSRFVLTEISQGQQSGQCGTVVANPDSSAPETMLKVWPDKGEDKIICDGEYGASGAIFGPVE